MNPSTQLNLTCYIIALVDEGFTAIHVSDVIPRGVNAPKGWEQFIDLPRECMATLESCGITYHRGSGWFRKVDEPQSNQRLTFSIKSNQRLSRAH